MPIDREITDVVMMGVIRERLTSIAEDIGHILIKGAFSSNIKESCVIGVLFPNDAADSGEETEWDSS